MSIINDNKKRKVALACANDPNTIMSYAKLVDSIMKLTSNKFQWNLISEEYPYGKPEVYGYFIKWRSGKDHLERDSEVIPSMIKKLRPEFLLSIGDLQYFKMTRYFIAKEVPWIHWMPIDNHDKLNLLKNKNQIENMDIPVAMSRFALDFCKSNRISIDDFIYPWIKTKPLAGDRVKAKEGDKRVFLGYRRVREGTSEHDEIVKYKKSLDLLDKDILLFVGRPGWRKNLEFLIGALKKLISERERKNVVLYFHTDLKDPSSTVNLPKLLHAFQIPILNFCRTKNMDWDSGIPEKILNLIYNMCTIYATPHGGEGFGLPIAEAMACEKPFVATNCTTTPEFSNLGENGFGARVYQENPDRNIMRPYVDLDDFCDKIEILLDSPSKRERMGRNAREWVKKNCCREVFTKKWMNVFDKINVPKAEILKLE